MGRNRAWVGIERRRRAKGDKWRAWVRVHPGKGGLKSKTYDLDTAPSVMQAWRTQQVELFGGPTEGGLAAEIATFLAKPEIAAQPHVHQTARMLGVWLDELGDVPRDSLTKDQFETVIQKWLKVYAEPTVYHRRSVLVSLYTVLDGEEAANPAKATTCPKSWIPADHSVPFATLTAIVDAMPDWRYVKKGIRVPSVAKLVARVMIATGLRPVDLSRVRRHHLAWLAESFLWPASKKGEGVDAHDCEMSEEALIAFRAFDAADAYNRFSPAAVSHSFKRAARQVCGQDTPIHLYTLRHGVGADLYRVTRDLATVGRLLGHAEGSRATPQYARGANAEVNRAAVQALSAARAQMLAPAASPNKSPEKSPRPKKASRIKQLRKRA